MSYADYDHRAPTLWVEQDAWNKIMRYTAIVPGEINGFGYLRVAAPDQLVLGSKDDVFITEQVVSAGSADVSEGDSAMAQYRALIDGRSDDLRFQWHSHGRLQAYCSSTDMTNIDNVGASGAEWWVSMVVNKAEQRFARLDVFRPLRISTVLQVRVYTNDPDLDAACRADIEAMVTQYVPPVAPQGARRRRKRSITVTSSATATAS